MIIKYAHIKWKNNNGKKSNAYKFAKPILEIKCDCCNKIFEEYQIVFEKRLLLINKEYCGKCSRPFMCSIAGKKGCFYQNGELKPNSGRFSKTKWDLLSKEQQQIQVKRANNALQQKLKNDEEYKYNHFQKVFKNSKIGYFSKGHYELHENIKHFGFIKEFQISNCSVDECLDELKIVVEYNGDFWHCNPSKWSKDDYNKAIKMTAGEKWESDRKRRFFIERLGYKVIIVWEENWKKNKFLELKRIENEINKKRKYREKSML